MLNSRIVLKKNNMSNLMSIPINGILCRMKWIYDMLSSENYVKMFRVSYSIFMLNDLILCVVRICLPHHNHPLSIHCPSPGQTHSTLQPFASFDPLLSLSKVWVLILPHMFCCQTCFPLCEMWHTTSSYLINFLHHSSTFGGARGICCLSHLTHSFSFCFQLANFFFFVNLLFLFALYFVFHLQTIYLLHLYL